MELTQDYYRSKEVVQLLGISLRTFYRYVKKGLLKSEFIFLKKRKLHVVGKSELSKFLKINS